jgi:ribosomal protein S27AE
MGLGIFARQYERVCSDCGGTWLVPRSMAHGGRRRGSAGTPSGGNTSDAISLVLPGPADRAARAADDVVLGRLASAEVRQAYRTCPKCGSDRFTQHPASGRR